MIRNRRKPKAGQPQAFCVTPSRAARRLGLDIVPCVVVDDDLRAELAMIDDNLCRAELIPADWASQTARRKAIYIELHPETAHGGDRRSDQVANLSTRSFADETAEATGKDARTIRRDAERGEKVTEAALNLVRGTAASSARPDTECASLLAVEIGDAPV